MISEYSENTLVQESAGHLLENELGWEVVYAYDKEVLGKDGTLGRTDYKEILLVRYLKAAIAKINPWINEAQTMEAIKALKTVLSSDTLMQTNEKMHRLICDGVDVTAKDGQGRQYTKKALLIDFNTPDNNHFLAVKEMKIHGDLYRRRTDIVGFVNGLPLLFVELKAVNVDVQNAFTDNYTDYLETIPHLFYYNAFLMLSNGVEAKVGTLGSKWEFFHEWKRLTEADHGNVELATMLRGICKKENFIDLLQNFIIYDHKDKGTAKILARNHQYLGVNEAVKAYAERKLKDGRLGVFWHTQGSGKSYSMVFFAKKIRRKFAGSPTIVVLTDRNDLNTQIADTFASCGMLGGGPAKSFLATSATDLTNKIKANDSFVFTLIQKFNDPNPTPLHTNYDILVMSDEAHRSQYGFYAENMMKLIPDCSRIGFTGTPLLSDDNITERTFGSHISIYDFQRAVDDHATVPLVYENRGQELGIQQMDDNDPELNRRIAEAIEEADLDTSQQEKLELALANEILVLTAEPRFDAIARDFVAHYSDLWTSGKAMFVCLNKVSCVRMYDLVRKYWQEAIEKLQKELKNCTQQQEALEKEEKLKWMQQTDMCVVVSQEQNEQQTFKKWGLDITPHRQRMGREKLDKLFKDSDSKLRVVFVTAMWLTGFDVPSLSCLYIDKPLVAHTLMQTIARANRVNEGKANGLILDYMGVVKALRAALADYTKGGDPGGEQGGSGSGGEQGGGGEGGGGKGPTIDKAKLIKQINELIARIKDFLSKHDFDLDKMTAAQNFDKLELLKDGANKMCATLEIKKTFQALAAELIRLFKYVRPKEVTPETMRDKDSIVAIYKKLQNKRKHADNTDLMVEINHIVNDYIEVDPTNVGKRGAAIDISKIDFDLLKKEFAKKKNKNKNLVIKDIVELVERRLKMLIKNNPTRGETYNESQETIAENNKERDRVNYYKEYQEIIAEYNKEHDSAEIEKVFMKLMNLVKELEKEEKRYIREGFDSDEQLTIFDLLLADNLSKKDIDKIKVVAKDLLKTVKEKIATLNNWTDKETTQNQVKVIIRDVLWSGLPQCYDDNDLAICRQKIYQHVYTRYKVVA